MPVEIFSTGTSRLRFSPPERAGAERLSSARTVFPVCARGFVPQWVAGASTRSRHAGR
ncbi:hypothetical protein [Streptomyces sp. NPDC048641]|uniref:hypothetical protein n=1 Tax=Streptomyces sp. NPDC048641 TaxID=3154825 RepID=UPI0034302108